MRLQVATLCKPGGRDRNEDAYGYWSSDAVACYVVSDGAGGHGGGDVASKAAVSQVLKDFTGGPQVTANGLADFIQRANLVVLEQQKTSAEYRDMRATLVVLCLDREHATAVWGHAGDSRLYCFREGRLVARTLDHSVIQKLVDAGRYDEQALRAHPQRSTLLLALGSNPEIEATILDEPFLLQDGDVFLLCSDGFWEYLDDALMENVLSQSDSPEAWVARLEAELQRRVPQRHDNYTGLALWLGDVRRPTENLTTVVMPGPLT